ncbi:Uncharacterised protein [Neisseria zoodegmatis]|uniref:Restriction endonuclease type IV Mrr domain-containing protein n=1 Tax=Neisseria zoodegmatis TaxID=326523 RepID=A0A378WIA9_9NEIS|nr:hypothetical protein [Neisseria zoodegmatis]SUA36627.1 Uncharacterised protein [Neisseria zoodegmatis]
MPKIRYIKLGNQGCWEQECIENGIVRFGYEGLHQEALNGEWGKLHAAWFEHRRDLGAATRDVNQIKDFYTLTDEDYFITFYKNQLWWCQPKGAPIEKEDGTRVRETLDGWHNSSRTNAEDVFWVQNVDGRITKVRGFRGTVCSIEQEQKLLRRINGELSSEIEEAQEALNNLKQKLENLIKTLSPQDFELLVDLVFSRTGWQRTSILGRTEKNIDLMLEHPIQGRTSHVQVKSSSNFKEAEDYINTHKNDYQENIDFYFIYHTSNDDITALHSPKNGIYIWDIEKIAGLVVDTGLIDWLIKRAK